MNEYWLKNAQKPIMTSYSMNCTLPINTAGSSTAQNSNAVIAMHAIDNNNIITMAKRFFTVTNVYE